MCVAKTLQKCESNGLDYGRNCDDGIDGLCYSGFVIDLIGAILAAFAVFFRSRRDVSLEVLALRQQVAVLKRKRRRLLLSRLDRLFWIMLRSMWPGWLDVVTIVKPATVIAWHRKGFRLYWRWRSRQRGGRPRITEEGRSLI